MRVHNPPPIQYTTPAQTNAPSNTNGASSQASFAAALAKYQGYGPSDSLRAQTLAQLGYTESQLKAMTPKAREAAEKRIAQMMGRGAQNGRGVASSDSETDSDV
ncbi:hypothetical protein [Pararobbsia silviterrae]|uniref:Uncharacterized protein n=1 Tax=Pararobbsia silviterrae TaxID=1792498 RepID=A0A494XZ80_9BURK|nr:hypothetical protein [Pararobbsia silviterrae]RKP53454.1 hypothetical protein D7S86_17290 [Pararobbsia silviterrae]